MPSLRSSSLHFDAIPYARSSGSGGGGGGGESASSWRKVLHVRQSQHPSNYVPPSFLDSLRTKGGLACQSSFMGYATGSLSVAQQFSAVAILLSVFSLLEGGRLAASELLVADGLVLVGEYGVMKWASAKLRCPGVQHEGEEGGGGGGGGEVDNEDEGEMRLSGGAMSSFLFVIWLRIFAPVLRSLTESYATDSVQALTCVMCLVHLISHNYSHGLSGSYKGGAVSLNAGIFTATLLASRLKSDAQVFCLTLLAVELFAFLPVIRDRLYALGTAAHVVFSLFMVSAGTLTLKHGIGTAAVAFYVMVVLFVVIVCPLDLKSLRKYKFHVRGPWDIAHVSPAECRTIMEQQQRQQRRSYI